MGTDAEQECCKVIVDRVCARLLAVAPPNRPRTIKALSNLMRGGFGLKLRTYTVRPTGLMQHLDGYSDEAAVLLRKREEGPPPCNEDFLEPFSEERLQDL